MPSRQDRLITLPATLAAIALLALSAAPVARAEPPAQPPSAQPAPPDPPRALPESPREAPADAYDKLPEIAKRMIESADGDAAAPAPPADPAPLTPVAHVETRGTGSVHLVLVPGLACDWTVWEPFMSRHAERYTMHALTLPGFAGSAAPPAPNAEQAKWSDDVWMLNARRAVGAAIDSLNLERPPVVVGHSMGAQVALRLAAEEPARAAAVVMVDGFAAWPLTPTPIPLLARRAMVENQLAGWFDTQMAANDAAGIRQMYIAGVTDPARGQALAAMSASTKTDVFKRYFLELVSADHTEALKTLKVPVLVIAAIPPAPPEPPQGQAGQPDSRETLRTAWQTQFQGLDNVRLEFIENCRHFIMDDAPERFDELVLAFSDTLRTPRGTP